jgi:hypothetical protein
LACSSAKGRIVTDVIPDVKLTSIKPVILETVEPGSSPGGSAILERSRHLFREWLQKEFEE